MTERKSALAVFAHPDDIEFVAAGTLLQLKEKGWRIHYMTLSGGDLGSLEHDREETRSIREKEGRNAAEILGATFHWGICNDMQIFYTGESTQRLGAVIRECSPSILLTHAPSDYMTDHENTSRLAVAAAFTRGMKNFETEPPAPEIRNNLTLYHAMPHGLRDPLRQRVRAGLYVNTASVHKTKREALAAHTSQKSFLDATQGMDSYLEAMDGMSRKVGKMSGCFEHAEGWRRHLHLGFSATDQDPLKEALGELCVIDEAYEQSLEVPR